MDVFAVKSQGYNRSSSFSSVTRDLFWFLSFLCLYTLYHVAYYTLAVKVYGEIRRACFDATDALAKANAAVIRQEWDCTEPHTKVLILQFLNNAALFFFLNCITVGLQPLT